MARLPKPPERRQRRNRRVEIVPAEDPPSAPPAPRHLLASTRELWREFWVTPEARAVRAVEMPMIQRLFDLYDERERAMRAVRRMGRMIRGSQGQRVLNPLLRYITECDKEIRALEDRLGFSRRALVALGVGFLQAQRSYQQLRESIVDDLDSDDDPRAQFPQQTQ